MKADQSQAERAKLIAERRQEAEKAMIRAQLALPMAKRTNFLRRRLANGGSFL